MSRAADHSPTPTPAPSSAPPANMPAVLNREPSQQDLEIARQLQSFQSQGVPSHEASKPDATSQATPQSLTQILSEGQPQAQADQASREQQQQQQQPQQHSPSPYPPTAQFTPLQPPAQQQRTPQSAPANNGQICSNCGTTKTPLWRRSPTGAVICNACGLYYKARNQMRPVGLKRGAAASTYPSENQSQDRATSPNTMQGGATYVSADQTSNGTCPGGGRCNGTGGHDGCSGCPAYNNRISKTAQVALRQASHGPGQPAQGEGSNQGQAGVQQSVMIACQNCGTTITPLWRRDEAGNTICNACGLYHKLHGHHRPVQMKKAEIKRRKRVVPNNLANDDHSSVYTAETAEDERRSIPPLAESHSPNYSHHPDNKQNIRLAGGPIPVDFTDTFRMRKRAAEGDSDTVPINPRKRSFSAAAQDHTSEPYPHAQNMAPTNDDNIDPALPAQNRAPSSESSRMSDKDKDARRAALQAEADKMLEMLQENQRQLKALNDE